MLSLTGSLQPDPFNPAHVPEANKSARKTLARTVVESDSTTVAKAQSASTSTTVESPAEFDSESTTAAIIQSNLDMAPLPYSESESSSEE